MIIALILVCLIIVALLISFYENGHFVVKRYDVKNEYFNERNIRTVFISDLHDCKYGKDNEKLINAIDEENPDFVIFGGDVFNGIKDKKNVNADSLIKAISGKYKSVYALGNHEFRYYLYPDEFPGCKEAFEKLLRDCNIRLLDNSCERLVIEDKAIDIYGLTIERKYYKRIKSENMPDTYVSEILGNKDKDVFSILLAHNPKYFKEYCEFGAQLILSGHYHGGIMRIFKRGVLSPDFKLFPKNSYGEIKNNKSTMIVSGGLGIHTLPFRIFNRPELVVIDFKG